MNTISLNLNFAGAVLPVVDCEDGHARVPLKPISDVFGLDWKNQKRKFGLQSDCADATNAGGDNAPRPGYLSGLLGLHMVQVFYAEQLRPMVCIRLDRVAGFLLTINPERVRAAGNEDGAAFLERKHAEWLDLIHAYEARRGDLFSERSVRKAVAIARIDRMRDPTLRRIALAEIGIELPQLALPGM